MRVYHVRHIPKIKQFTEVYEYHNELSTIEYEMLDDAHGYYDLDSDSRLLFNIDYKGYRDIKYKYFYEFFVDVIRDKKLEDILK